MKSSDGFWLIFNRYTGASQFCLDPSPPEPATSFLGRDEAEGAMRACALPSLEAALAKAGVATYKELIATGFEGVLWAVVPDPNP